MLIVHLAMFLFTTIRSKKFLVELEGEKSKKRTSLGSLNHKLEKTSLAIGINDH